MSAVTEQTVEYLKVRKQFGQPLAKFQVLQHRLVDMNISCEEARAATHAALTAADNGEPDAQTKIWRAKVQVGRSARYVWLAGSAVARWHGNDRRTCDRSLLQKVIDVRIPFRGCDCVLAPAREPAGLNFARRGSSCLSTM